MGKAGHRAVSDFWRGDAQQFGTREDRAEYVADVLAGLRFVYKYPNETVSVHFLRQPGTPVTVLQFERGAFCSDLISKVFAKHLQKIEGVKQKSARRACPCNGCGMSSFFGIGSAWSGS
jgi:hypothetical protein